MYMYSLRYNIGVITVDMIANLHATYMYVCMYCLHIHVHAHVHVCCGKNVAALAVL